MTWYQLWITKNVKLSITTGKYMLMVYRNNHPRPRVVVSVRKNMIIGFKRLSEIFRVHAHAARRKVSIMCPYNVIVTVMGQMFQIKRDIVMPMIY